MSGEMALEAIIGEHLPIEPAHSGFLLATCPFCAPVTYSLVIDPAVQTWGCRSCNAHGDVLSFLMRYHRVPFAIALRMLTDRAANAERA